MKDGFRNREAKKSQPRFYMPGNRQVAGLLKIALTAKEILRISTRLKASRRPLYYSEWEIDDVHHGPIRPTTD